jgi:hypothetical protein
MDDLLAHKLAQLRQSPHFESLKEYLKGRIEAARDQMEVLSALETFWETQGEIAALRSILKDFEQLDLFVQNRDNSNASLGEDKEI